MPARYLQLLFSAGFLPHGHCFLWNPGLLWLHGVSDGLIAFAYYAIPLEILYFVRRRRDLPFPRIFWLFGAFILACGTTHVLEVWTLWNPDYWLAGGMKALTAALSVIAAIALVSIIPAMLAMRAPADLEKLNLELETARDAALASAALFQGLLESAPDGMVIVDDTGSISLINSQTERFFGYSREELVGASLQKLIPLRFREQHPGYRSAYFSDPKVRAMGSGLELYGLRKDGTEFPVEISLSPLETPNGRLVCSAIRDATERRRTERQLREANQSEHHYATQLEAANKELEAFSYSVSHDLRAPLRSIDGFSLALLEDYADRLDHTGKDFLARIRTATQRMAQLIDDLLSLAQVSRTELRQEPVDLGAMAERIVANFRSEDPSRQIEFLAPTGVIARGDPRLLRVVLDNLLGNAWKFTSKKPCARIELSARQENGTSVYSIRDDGAGFNMEYADKLFGTFQRLHAATEFSGTGVGLAIVQRIIHRHGGRIWAQGAEGEGATFSFTL